MVENKEKETKQAAPNREMEIPTTDILKLKELQKYAKDFLRVLLPNKMYKPSEAIKIVKNYFKE